MKLGATARLAWCLLFSWSLVGCAGSRARPESPTRAAPGVHSPLPNTPGLFLYAVDTPAGTTHLLGTIHVGFGFHEVLTPDASARFASAKRVMTEADVTAIDPAKLIQSALLPSDRTLHGMLGEQTWQKLVTRLGAQIPPMIMDRLKPWMPAVTLGLDDLEDALQQLKPDAEGRMMDLELLRSARESGKEISYLETVDEQIAVFDTIPLNEQVRELEQTLSRETTGQGRAMLEAFASGDELALSRALFDQPQLASAPGFYDAVLFSRNARWLPLIERELARGGTFIAVGAAHLLGEKGLLHQLEARGHRVRRVGGS